jgi:ABC-type oligopeptide transport system substrate-binding subunit/DNA-binding SARP family transcriptional activator
MSRVALYLLGAPRLERDGEPVAISRRKVMALLAYLAVAAQPQSREALVTLLSPELDTSHARAEFRRTLALLKRTLGPGQVLASRETVALKSTSDPRLWVDVSHFRTLLAPCQAADHPPDESAACPACAPLLQEAVALYRDDFLAGFNLPDSLQFEEWQFFQAEALQELLAGALQRLVTWHHAQGAAEVERAIAYARRWLALDPLHEPAHRRLMALYAQAGRRSAAVRQYRTCLRLLEEELGVQPSAETTALYQRIRAEDIAREERSPGLVTMTPPASSALPAFLSEETAPTRGERTLFVARERQLGRLDGLLQAALHYRGQIAFVTGGPGRGKTALMEAFAQRAMDAHPDLLVAVGRCNAYSGSGDPYLPFRDLLGTLSGDVEGRWRAGAVSREHAQRLWRALPVTAQALAEHGAPLIDTLVPGGALLSRAAACARADTVWLGRLRELVEGEKALPSDLAQNQIFTAYLQVLRGVAARHPLLLLLDDLQWADSASAQLLFHLGRELAGAPILILGAYRPEEVALARHGERHPLAKPLAEFKRGFGDVWLDLTELDELEGRHFVDALLDAEPNRLQEPFRKALHGHTGGHPLFTVELLRAMQERGDLVQDAAGRWVEGRTVDWECLPPRVEGVIQERVGRLNEALRDVLSIASVEGEVFTMQVLAAVQGSEPRQLLRTLSRQLEGQHRLVRELETLPLDGQSLYRYRFSHVLFQRYLYDDLSQGERVLLHGEVAQALEALYDGGTDAIAVPLARHYAQAAQSEKAIHYSLQAGDQARLAYALDEAVDHYQAALAFQRELGDYHGAARTWMKLGLTHHSAFRFQAARQAYDEGFALWHQAATSASTIKDQPAPHALRSILDQPPLTLDPTVVFDSGGWLLIDQLFSGLLELTPELEAVPDVARSWEVSPDGRRYLFHLRDDARWSDGVAVTAEDFCCAWKRRLDPAIASPMASYLYDIRGARAFHQRETHNPETVGVRALDNLTLEVELEAPTAYFPLLITNQYPVPRHVVETHGAAWTDPQHIVTNGPFRQESRRPDGSMVLVRNPRYHGRFPGNVERVEIMNPPRDPSLELQMYEEGHVDVIRASPLLLDQARQRHADELLTVPALKTFWVWFNVRKTPFDDRRVRRAFVMATDRNRLADILLKGFVSPATGGFTPPGMPGHVADIGLPYNPEQARWLLAAAGYADHGGRTFPPVELLHWGWGSGYDRAVTRDLVVQWRRNLAVEIRLVEPPEFDAFEKWTKGDRPHMYYRGWSAEYPDPDNVLRLFFSDHRAGWHHQDYFQLVEKARRLTDQAQRMALYRQAELILVQEAPIIPLFYPRFLVLVKPWIRGFLLSPAGQETWQNVIIEPHEER